MDQACRGAARLDHGGRELREAFAAGSAASGSAGPAFIIGRKGSMLATPKPFSQIADTSARRSGCRRSRRPARAPFPFPLIKQFRQHPQAGCELVMQAEPGIHMDGADLGDCAIARANRRTPSAAPLQAAAAAHPRRNQSPHRSRGKPGRRRAPSRETRAITLARDGRTAASGFACRVASSCA